MSNAADLGSVSIGGNFVYGGPNNSDGAIDTGAFHGNAFESYAGTNNNYAGVVAQNVISGTQGLFQSYSGYAIGYTGALASAPAVNQQSALMDNQQILTWPKDQHIYYKLVGYNTITQAFESWIITEEIVPRPETFDPTGNFPNIDYNVFFTPPSGNTLSNIKIVGRWIQ